MKTWCVGLMVVAGVVALAACGGDDDTTVDRGAGSVNVDGRTFLSTSATPALVAGSQLRLTFADGRVSANAGCNTMSGTYRFDDDVLVVGELGQTEMGCDAALMDQDQRIAALLMTKPAWSLRGDRLVLSGGGTRIELLDRKVAEPDQPLLGTKWTVQDVGNGDTVSHSTSGDAWLQFDGNAVHGSTGCNTVTGTFERDGDTLTFADVRTTLRKCPDAPYEAPMLAVLNRTARFAIDGTRLVLTGADGTSIGFSG